MSATHFIDGDDVTASWFNSNYYSGGHKHDGSDNDGHASQIDLTAHVQNQLPSANIGMTYGTFVGRLHLSGGSGSFFVDSTFGYSLLTGRATIWWDNLVAPSSYKSNQFYYSDATIGDATNHKMPTVLSFTASDQIIGTAMFVKDEQSNISTDSTSATHMCMIQIGTSAPIQLKFLKDRNQEWYSGSSDQTIMAGQVTYQTPNFRY